MAELQTERRPNPWVLVFGLILLALIVWWVLGTMADDAPEDLVVDTTGIAEPVLTPDVIDDIAIIIDAPDPTVFAGREVRIARALVREEASMGFWIGGGAGDPGIFVLETSEPRDEVRPGNIINLVGRLRPVPARLDSLEGRWELDSTTATRLRDEPLYIDAIDIAVLPVEP